MEGLITLSISPEYPSRLEHVVDSVIQQHIEQHEEYVVCLGTVICDFFHIPHRVCSARPSKHSKSKRLCRSCGRSLKRYILETSKSGFDIFQERRCSMINPINPTFLQCVGFIWNEKDMLISTCPKHTCNFCLKEAHKDIELIVWARLCLNRLHIHKDIILLIMNFIRPVFCISGRKMHLTKYDFIARAGRIDSFNQKVYFDHVLKIQ